MKLLGLGPRAEDTSDISEEEFDKDEPEETRKDDTVRTWKPRRGSGQQPSSSCTAPKAMERRCLPLAANLEKKSLDDSTWRQ